MLDILKNGDYQMLNVIGKDGYRIDLKIRSNRDREIYALSQILLNCFEGIEREEILDDYKRSIKFYQKHPHSNAIRIHEYYYDLKKKELSILMDFHPYQSLDHYYLDNFMSKNKKLELSQFSDIFSGLLSGIHFFLEGEREIPVYFLAPEDIQISSENKPIIRNLGKPKFNEKSTDMDDKVKWMSPEMRENFYKKKEFSSCSAPIFSLGLICLFLLDYENFKEKNVKGFFNIQSNYGELMKYLEDLRRIGVIPRNFFYTLRSMLSFHPKSRPGIKELYEDFKDRNLLDKKPKEYEEQLETENQELKQKVDQLQAELSHVKSEINIIINAQPQQPKNVNSKLGSNKAFDTIRKFELSDFTIPSDKTLLGKGTFGKVEKIKFDNKNIALKTINDLQEISENPVDIANELTIVLLLDHPNLVKGYKYYIDEEKDNLLIMMECHGIDLQSFFEEGEKISNMNIFLSDFFSQTVRGLHFAWEKMQAVHRDLKPQNILYDKTSNIFKVADFGCAKIIRSGKILSKKKMTGGRGTEIFMAPEQLKNIDSDFYVGDPKRADIFTIGLIILHMILFKDKVKSHLYKANEDQSSLLELLRLASKKGLPKLIEFILPSMLSYNSEMRPDIVELFYMMDVFEKEKPQHIDSVLFDKLITLEASKAAIWVKYLAPYLIFGATDSKTAKEGSFNFQILIKSGKFTEKSLALAFSDEKNKHLPLILSFLLTSKPNRENIPSEDLDKFLELFEKSKISVLNRKSALEILKQAKDKAESWVRNVSPLIIQNETHSNSNLQNYIENLSFMYS